MSSPLVHMVNHGLVSAFKGFEIECFNFLIGTTGAVGALEQGKANFIDNVTRTSAGLYTIQVTLAYPAVLVTADPNLSLVGATDTVLRIGYVQGSYSNTTGQFQIQVTNTTGPSAADPVSGSSIMVNCVFRRYTAE